MGKNCPIGHCALRTHPGNPFNFVSYTSRGTMPLCNSKFTTIITEKN